MMPTGAVCAIASNDRVVLHQVMYASLLNVGRWTRRLSLQVWIVAWWLQVPSRRVVTSQTVERNTAVSFVSFSFNVVASLLFTLHQLTDWLIE